MLINPNLSDTAFLGLFLLTLLITALALKLFDGYLPTDRGRDFAYQGGKSAGKKTSSGIIFVTVFALLSIILLRISWEMRLYIIAIYIEMLTGFFDDNSERPWGELQKGLLDLAVAIFISYVYLRYNSNSVIIGLSGKAVGIPYLLYFCLIIILVWVSINLTNITDGVDGLSSSLSLIFLGSALVLGEKLGTLGDAKALIIVYSACLLVYLWLNADPSSHLMGDAGSRATGAFLSIIILKTKAPFSYIPLALMIIIDGGSSLIKLSTIRYLKKNPLKNIQTPLHDHTRKKKGWSNSQTVTRFCIIQLIISIAYLSLV